MNFHSPFLYMAIMAVLVVSFFLITIIVKNEKIKFRLLIVELILVLGFFGFSYMTTIGDGVMFEDGTLLVTHVKGNDSYVERIAPVGEIKMKVNKDKKNNDKVIVTRNLIRGTTIFAPEKDIQSLVQSIKNKEASNTTDSK